jgi:hypothetical protein
MKQLILEVTDETYNILQIVTNIENERLGVAETVEQHTLRIMNTMLETRKDEILQARAKRLATDYLTDPVFRAKIEDALNA